MSKRIIWLLTLSLTLLVPSARLLAAEEGGEAKTAHAPERTAGGHEGPEYHLMPQSSEEWHQALYSTIWILVIFVVLLAFLYPMAWRHVLDGLQKREQRIRTDVAEAEAARARSEALLKQFDDQIAAAHSRSSQMISEATVQSEKLATQIRMQAQQETEAAMESATQEMEAARDAALQDIRKEVGTLATMVASKVMGRNLGAADHRDLVDEAIASMQSA
jgi:F-type H+-transporting ATPase subunit b